MELDLTPVMNMFLILVPFLVSMAVFTQVAIIEFSLPPNVGAGLDDSLGKPKLKLTVVLGNDHSKVTLGERMLDSIPSAGDRFDTDSLLARLKVRRAGADIQDEVIVAVLDPVRFKHVVNVMDVCRDAGFEKIGLSSAADEGL